MQARDIMVAQNGIPPTNYPVNIAETGPPYNFVRVSSAQQVPIWGDYFARLKKVYTGTNLVPKSQWYDPPLVSNL